MLALLCAPLGLVPCRVALECSFGGAMNPRERKSLAHQIVRCYGHNRKAKRPLDLHLSGMAEAAQHPDVLPADGHWQAWTDITLVQPSAEEAWPGEVVWLTPDASEPLLELDPTAVYVIGGLIDRSVASQATLRRAEAHRVSARRLPLREFAPQHGQSATLGSAPARLLCLLRARLAVLISSVLPGRGSAGRPATAWGARASRLQSR